MVEEMHDAKEYGSIIHVTPCDWDLLRRFAVPREEEGQLHLDIHGEVEASARLQAIINTAETLAQKYHVVVTNPPYMNNGNMSQRMLEYVKRNYLIAKSDLCTVVMMRCTQMLSKYGVQGMITQQAWMFLSSYEELRKENLNYNIINLVHLGARAFEEIAGEVVQTVSWTQRKLTSPEYKGTFVRLTDYIGQTEKEDAFLSHQNEYKATILDFEAIPSSPVVYWLSQQAVSAFKGMSISDVSNPKRTLQTGDSKRFMRNWYEVSADKTSFEYCSRDDALASGKKWFMFSYGGQKRKWYGNLELVVNWENNGFEIKKSGKAIIPSEPKYFIENIGWSKVTSGDISMRYYPSGILPGDASACLFDCEKDIFLLEGYLNSKVAMCYLAVLSPTLNYATGTVAQVPYLKSAIEERRESIEPIVRQNNHLCKEDWDDFETSWDFIKHPFIACISCPEDVTFFTKKGSNTIESAFNAWRASAETRFRLLKSNEEELNRIFIDIYGLQDELTPIVDNKDVSVRTADLQRDVRSFISYAVGCMFGRYSLDVPGLAFAGGEWDVSKYIRYQPDKDAIIPICDDEYFEDDIIGRFVKFVEVVYGKETLEENLRFIADALGGKGSSREVIRSYFINDFYADHLKVYQKRPIYWLFDSGKKNGFKCLIYMHRYQPDTIARIRTDYVHEQQSRYRTAIADLELRMGGASTSERVKLSKQLAKLQAQAEEIRVYEEKIHHLADQMIKIDLDDGVKHNYEIFKDVLAKIK